MFASVRFSSHQKPGISTICSQLSPTIGDKKSPCLSLGRNCSSIELQRQMPVIYWHRRHPDKGWCTHWLSHSPADALFPSLRGVHSPETERPLSAPVHAPVPQLPESVDGDRVVLERVWVIEYPVEHLVVPCPGESKNPHDVFGLPRRWCRPSCFGVEYCELVVGEAHSPMVAHTSDATHPA